MAEELPFFHIECKGTKAQKLNRSTIRDWWRQIHKDVKQGKLPVIFHIANGCEPISLVPDSVIDRMKIYPYFARKVKGDSVTPIEHIGTWEALQVYGPGSWGPFSCMAFFPVSDEEKIYIIRGSDFLEAMKTYGPCLRVEKATSR